MFACCVPLSAKHQSVSLNLESLQTKLSRILKSLYVTHLFCHRTFDGDFRTLLYLDGKAERFPPIYDDLERQRDRDCCPHPRLTDNSKNTADLSNTLLHGLQTKMTRVFAACIESFSVITNLQDQTVAVLM